MTIVAIELAGEENRFVRAQARARREQRLTREEIERIHEAAETALPRR